MQYNSSMIYIICPLDVEARVFIDYYKLKKLDLLPFNMYQNSDMILVVSGVGKTNALMATTAICGCIKPSESDILVNIGTCGGSGEIGTPFIINKIIDNDKSYYPDILYHHDLDESAIISLDAPAYNNFDSLVDMESSAIFIAASRFFKLHQMVFIRVISDNFNPLSVTKELMIDTMGKNVQKIDSSIKSALKTLQKNELFSEEEKQNIEQILEFFTATEQKKLMDSFKFYKHRGGVIELDIKKPLNKQMRKKLYDELLERYYAI